MMKGPDPAPDETPALTLLVSANVWVSPRVSDNVPEECLYCCGYQIVTFTNRRENTFSYDQEDFIFGRNVALKKNIEIFY